MRYPSIFTAILLSSALAASAQAMPLTHEAEGARDYASAVDEEARLDQVRELIGPRGKRLLKTASRVPASKKNIEAWLRDSLSKKNKRLAPKIAREIIAQSKEHEFDPVFLMAVIMTESSFNPKARGSAGEIGLMQIMPGTGEWIARKIGLKWKGAKTLENPVHNVRIGATYLSMLREKFDSHGRLYLAAYNMGAKNVNRALDKRVWPKDYPIAVMKNYLAYYDRMREELAAAAGKASERKPAS